MYTSFNARALGLDLTARESIELAARSGFEGVDLLVRDLVNRGENPTDLRKLMDDLQVRPGAFGLPIDWRTRDPHQAERDLERLPHFTETAAILGLRSTGTWIFPELETEWLEQPGPHGWPEDHRPINRTEVDRAVDWTVSWLLPIVKILAQAEIRLGIEWIGSASFRVGRPLTFIHSLRDHRLQQIIDALNARLPANNSAVGVLYDAFHLHAAGDFDAPERAWAERNAVWVHVADLPDDAHNLPREKIRDSDRGLPGDCGLIPVDEFLLSLKKSGYTGPVTAEPLATCRRLQPLSPLERALAARESLKRVWPVERQASAAK